MLKRTNLSVLAAVAAVCAIGASSAQAAWTVTSGTPPANTASLAGVSCTSTTFCLLAGPQSGTTTRAFVQKYTGSLTTLSTASTTSELEGVGCASSTLCFVAGTDFSPTVPAPHEESFNGTSFSNSTSAVPASSTFSELDGTACPSTTSCFSVGSYTTSTATQPLIEHWTGTSWGIQSMTLPSGTVNASLSDVSCTSTTACTAVGQYTTSTRTSALIERYNGTAWTFQTEFIPSGASPLQLDGVSCTTSTACVAVGNYTDASAVQHALAEHWNGTSWSQRTVADPSGSTSSALSDVSCYTTASAGCIAVGGYTDSGGVIQPEAVGYNGTAWSLQSITRPGISSNATLNGVSCTSSTFCMAVGAAVTTATGVVGPVVYKGP
jgi:hypothetical protein